MSLGNQKDQITFVFECYASWQMLVVLSENGCVRILKKKLVNFS